MFTLHDSGSFKNLETFLKKMEKGDLYSELDGLAKKGVAALASATPRDSGLAASSWGYKIEKTKDEVSIYWTNTNVEGGQLVVILLQYGHGTGTGGYVEGRDYINPAIQPVFDRIVDSIWMEVKSL